jgi:hypothetical protein
VKGVFNVVTVIVAVLLRSYNFRESTLAPPSEQGRDDRSNPESGVTYTN